jgi:hydrogenase expression/formation protein HypD
MVATFGDMLRVPGAGGRTLKEAQAEGASVTICYSPLEALKLAQRYPEREVVFLGVGFETTAPTVAAAVKQAEALGLDNFSVFSCHKLIPPALAHLLRSGEVRVEAFILPGHVSTVIGTAPYAFLAEELGVPAVVAGFEPADILQALLAIIRMRKARRPRVHNAYGRAVHEGGNPKARAVMNQVFEVAGSTWRGLGFIPESGLVLSEEYAAFDAGRRFGLEAATVADPPGCRCGEVLKGLAAPRECRLFGTICTPASPVGPCMVSSEGSCAAHYKYGLDES